MFKYIFAGFILLNLGLINAFEIPETKVEGKPVCEVCTLVLSAAQSLLKQNKTDEQVIQFIEKELCSRLGSLSQTCSQYVEQYGPQILYMLATGVDPSIVCNHLGLCQTVAIQTPRLPVISDTLNCTLCKLVFTQVQNMLKNNASEEELLQLIEKTLCNATGSFSQTCKNLLETYGPSILKYLAQGVDPGKLCTLIGMCSKASRKTMPLLEKVKLAENYDKIAKLNKLVSADPPYCTICQYAVQFIDVELKKNSTEQAIVDALEGACKLAPAQFANECQIMVKNYGIYLVQLLIQLGDPLKVCELLKLC